MSHQFSILVKFPTRNRPERFLDYFKKYVENQLTQSVHYLITLDTDDVNVNADFINRIQQVTKEVTIIRGYSNSKIHACNRGIEHAPKPWDILILASDDMLPVCLGWDEVIIKAMGDNWSDTDGVLCFSDGYTALNTMCILGKAYYDRFGYIYHPDYQSMWCDNEFQDVSQQLGKEKRFKQVLFKHEHPANIGSGTDPLYQLNDKLYHSDYKVYLDRKAKNFDL